MNSMTGDIERFLDESRLAPKTQDLYRHYLNVFATWIEENKIDPEKVTVSQVKQLIKSHEWANSTQYSLACALRAFVSWKWGSAHSLMHLRIKREDPGPQRTLTEDELLNLLASFDRSTPVGIRNFSMVLLMVDTGLRASEICRLKMDQVSIEGLTLTVKVKGSKYQTKVFTQETAGFLQAWLDVRASIARPGVKTLFVAIKGIKPGTPMNSDGLRTVFRRMSEKAALPLISPHVLRRTMATLAIRAGAPTRLVQVQGGWSSVRMVERYSSALRPEDFAPFSPVARILQEQLTEI